MAPAPITYATALRAFLTSSVFLRNVCLHPQSGLHCTRRFGHTDQPLLSDPSCIDPLTPLLDTAFKHVHSCPPSFQSHIPDFEPSRSRSNPVMVVSEPDVVYRRLVSCVCFVICSKRFLPQLSFLETTVLLAVGGL